MLQKLLKTQKNLSALSPHPPYKPSLLSSSSSIPPRSCSAGLPVPDVSVSAIKAFYVQKDNQKSSPTRLLHHKEVEKTGAQLLPFSGHFLRGL